MIHSMVVCLMGAAVPQALIDSFCSVVTSLTLLGSNFDMSMTGGATSTKRCYELLYWQLLNQYTPMRPCIQ